MKIQLLPDSVINQIAAGEVIERPASVVRELVDNAVDAGASEISVFLEEGGRDDILVVDNGCGMSRDDALLACERHATSKIKESGDLAAIRTLGFRGEALSSIAAVSRLRLRTRSRDEQAATEIVLTGGVLQGVSTVAGTHGTEIQVSQLFSNVPARRKFLRQPPTEEQRVRQWLLQSSLARPALRYRLESGGKPKLNLAPADSMLDRARGLFKGTVVTFEETYGPLILRGLVCHPAMAQADTSAFVILVNERLVSDRLVLKAVRDAFHSSLKHSEYPLGFISLTLPPGEVDVNVHPQKSEVRFKESRAVFAAVRSAVENGLRDFSAPVAQFSPHARPSQAFAVHEPAPEPTSFEWNTARPPAPLPCFEAAPEAAPRAERQAFRFSALRYIGQALACYLFGELDGVVYVIDMHAAHERCNYNLIRERLASKAVEGQMLMVPLPVEVGEAGVENCTMHRELLASFGFEVEPFGEGTLLVRAVPALLRDQDATGLIKEIAALPLEAGAPDVAAPLDRIAARLACHASIRSGRPLNREEAYALFEALDRTNFSTACPHGRPVVVSLTAGQIERWFGRDR